MPRNLPAALIILDGWGTADPGPGNAVAAAHTPNLDRVLAEYPTSHLKASGLAVGLPEGQMGNSEVGHLNIGAGRVVYQELTRINLAIEDGSLAENAVIANAIDAAVSAGHAVHLMGLVSDGGVHSHQEHLYALVRFAAARGATDVRIHAFLDGRDVPPESGAGFLGELEAELAEIGVGRIVSVMGRYWAMDRDNRWERVERAYDAMVLAQAPVVSSAVEAVRASYAAGVTDEFVEPVVVAPGIDAAAGAAPDDAAAVRAAVAMGDGDAVVFFNFRPDRAREITRVLVDPEFAGFARRLRPDLHFVCLTEYDPTIPASVAFPKNLPCCVLADVLAEAGLRQLHIAETEKYAHVTFFLNGGAEAPKHAEERVLVPSPKVATYDLQPEMSAPEVTRELVSAIAEDRADVYIVNYANCDMVGHTGVFDAARRAVEAVDAGVGEVLAAIRERGGVAIITADHGNAERMVDSDGATPFTAHTLDDVPICVVAPALAGLRDDGILADVAPTLLELIGVAAPDQWTGRSLLLY